VAGVYTDNGKTKARMGDAYQATIDRGLAAERHWLETGQAETIPAVALDGGDVAMPLREAYEFYGTPRGGVPNYVNGYAVQSLAYSLPFDARGAAETIEVPVLIVHSERALAPRSCPRLPFGCEVAQARTLARVAGPDRFLRRPETRHPGGRCCRRIPRVERMKKVVAGPVGV
jgi:hypothetical protein